MRPQPPNLSFSLHLEKSAQKAFAVLRMTRRTFSRITRTDFETLCGAYVRPLLEYANPVVYSGRTKDNSVQNTIRHSFTRVFALANILPRAENLLRGDLILTYALFEQGLANRFFTVDPANTRRGH
ncbi:hypothetical protein CLF_101164, partial [Clonorchis sinensis]